MLHEVKVLNPDGTIKEVIDAKEVTHRYWENVRRTENLGIRAMRGKQIGAKHVKKSEG